MFSPCMYTIGNVYPVYYWMFVLCLGSSPLVAPNNCTYLARFTVEPCTDTVTLVSPISDTTRTWFWFGGCLMLVTTSMPLRNHQKLTSPLQFGSLTRFGSLTKFGSPLPSHLVKNLPSLTILLLKYKYETSRFLFPFSPGVMYSNIALNWWALDKSGRVLRYFRSRSLAFTLIDSIYND